jgi:hypothetical protein
MLAWFLILAAVLLRLLPHVPNFAPVTAMALFGGTYLGKKWAVIIPLVAMFISDYFIGFYSPAVMASVYLSFVVSGLLGLWLRRDKSFGRVVGATMLGSVLFFLVTNAAVWAFGTMYQHTAAGLLESYFNGLPFFRGTFLGDLFYSGVLFGTYELVSLWLKRGIFAKVS